MSDGNAQFGNGNQPQWIPPQEVSAPQQPEVVFPPQLPEGYVPPPQFVPTAAPQQPAPVDTGLAGYTYPPQQAPVSAGQGGYAYPPQAPNGFPPPAPAGFAAPEQQMPGPVPGYPVPPQPPMPSYGPPPGAPGPSPGMFPPPPAPFDYSFGPQAQRGVDGTVRVQLPKLGPVAVAGMGRRFLARLVDGVLIWLIEAVVVGIAVGIGGMPHYQTTYDEYGYSTTTHTGLSLGALYAVLALVGLAVGVYEWMLTAIKGATVGKMAMGLRVVDEDTGDVIGAGRALIRQLVPAAGVVLCGIGTLLVYLSPLFDNSGKMQGWHDKAARDLVISVK